MAKKISQLLVLALLTGLAVGASGCCHLKCQNLRDKDEPIIVCQPADQLLVHQGFNIKLNVTARGAAPLYYEWYFQSNSFAIPVPVEDLPGGYLGGKVEGFDTSELKIYRASTNATGFYSCVVGRNDCQKGTLTATSVSAYVHVREQLIMSTPPSYGIIKPGKQPGGALCSGVGNTYVAYATIMSCPANQSALFMPVNPIPPGGLQLNNLSVQNSAAYPGLKLAIKLYGIATPTQCCFPADQGNISITLPVGTKQVMFTAYFASQPAGTTITLIYDTAQITPYPSCP